MYEFVNAVCDSCGTPDCDVIKKQFSSLFGTNGLFVSGATIHRDYPLYCEAISQAYENAKVKCIRFGDYESAGIHCPDCLREIAKDCENSNI